MYRLYANFQHKISVSTKIEPINFGALKSYFIVISGIVYFVMKHYHLAQDTGSKTWKRFILWFRNGSKNKTHPKMFNLSKFMRCFDFALNKIECLDYSNDNVDKNLFIFKVSLEKISQFHTWEENALLCWGSGLNWTVQD